MKNDNYRQHAEAIEAAAELISPGQKWTISVEFNDAEIIKDTDVVIRTTVARTFSSAVLGLREYLWRLVEEKKERQANEKV
jgi:hypothetical protein